MIFKGTIIHYKFIDNFLELIVTDNKKYIIAKRRVYHFEDRAFLEKLKNDFLKFEVELIGKFNLDEIFLVKEVYIIQ